MPLYYLLAQKNMRKLIVPRLPTHELSSRREKIQTVQEQVSLVRILISR